MKPTPLHYLISLIALILAAAHLIWPTVSIDAVTISLIVVAILPWLGTVFKALEFPGGLKVEYQDLQRVAQKADMAGLLPVKDQQEREPYSFTLVADQDPNLALAGLRIEIEKRLVALAEAHKITVGPKKSVGFLLRILGEREILTREERSVLADMLGLLNSAVHGAKVDPRAAEWAIEMGPRLLEGIAKRINA